MSTTRKHNNPIELGEGVVLGVKVGGVLALLYSLAFTLLLCYGIFFLSPDLSFQQKINRLLFFPGLLGIAPGFLATGISAVIGGTTGIILVVLVNLLARYLSKSLAFILGVFVGCCLAYPINQFFWPLSFEGRAAEISTWYAIGLGILSLIYVVSGGWVSLALYKKACDVSDKEVI